MTITTTLAEYVGPKNGKTYVQAAGPDIAAMIHTAGVLAVLKHYGLESVPADRVFHCVAYVDGKPLRGIRIAEADYRAAKGMPAKGPAKGSNVPKGRAPALTVPEQQTADGWIAAIQRNDGVTLETAARMLADYPAILRYVQGAMAPQPPTAPAPAAPAAPVVPTAPAQQQQQQATPEMLAAYAAWLAQQQGKPAPSGRKGKGKPAQAATGTQG